MLPTAAESVNSIRLVCFIWVRKLAMNLLHPRADVSLSSLQGPANTTQRIESFQLGVSVGCQLRLLSGREQPHIDSNQNTACNWLRRIHSSMWKWHHLLHLVALSIKPTITAPLLRLTCVNTQISTGWFLEMNTLISGSLNMMDRKSKMRNGDWHLNLKTHHQECSIQTAVWAEDAGGRRHSPTCLLWTFGQMFLLRCSVYVQKRRLA